MVRLTTVRRRTRWPTSSSFSRTAHGSRGTRRARGDGASPTTRARSGSPRPSASATLIYVAGQVAWDKDGEIVGKGDLLAQSRQVFKNISEILDLAGASLNDVVRLTQYFMDMSDIHPYRQARREAMPGVACITTGIQVARMTHPDLLLEIEAMAVV